MVLTGRALQGPRAAEGTETHHRPERRVGTENSQLPHWLVVSIEEDCHGDQDIATVRLAESMEVGDEARPLQKGLEKKKWGSEKGYSGTLLVTSNKTCPQRLAFHVNLGRVLWEKGF